MHRLTVKTSTIFIAKGGRTRVFHSIQEVPKRLRDQLEQSTNGFNSATILIADRRGRQEIIRALHGLPSALRTRLTSSLALPSAKSAPLVARIQAQASVVARFARRNWLSMLLPLAAGASAWLAFNYR